MSKAASYDHYGTLVTVASLLLVVVYASDGYDEWDLLIALVGSVYGCSYLKSRAYIDKPARLLGSLVSAAGVSIAIASLVEIVLTAVHRGNGGESGEVCSSPPKSIDCFHWVGIDALFVVVVVLTFVAYLVTGRLSSESRRES